MVKTLRITSIVVAVTAAGLLILLTIHGVRKVPQIEEFLKAPDAVDEFTTGKGRAAVRDESQVSPLVKQAADFARYLNPPPPPPPPRAQGETASAQPQPVPMAAVSAKFDLIGTSFYAANPEKSLALIDEPGKGLNWVRQGGSVGHLVIERIGDGVVTMRDGTRTFEMTVKVKESWRNLLKNPPPETRPGLSDVDSSASAPPDTDRSVISDAVAGRGLSRAARGASPQSLRRQRAVPEPVAMGQVPPQGDSTNLPSQSIQGSKIEGQEKVGEISGVSEQGAEPAVSSGNALMDQLVSELNSSKVTGDEAHRIEQLIKALQQTEGSSAGEPEPQPESTDTDANQ